MTVWCPNFSRILLIHLLVHGIVFRHENPTKRQRRGELCDGLRLREKPVLEPRVQRNHKPETWTPSLPSNSQPISPSINSTNRLQIERPKPVSAIVSCGRTISLRKSLKQFFFAFSGMPTPVSVTEKFQTDFNGELKVSLTPSVIFPF